LYFVVRELKNIFTEISYKVKFVISVFYNKEIHTVNRHKPQVS
jgi:hypothetical protein